MRRAERALEFVRQLIALRRDAPGAAPARLLPGPPAARPRGQGHRLAQARRRRDDRRGMGSALRAVPRRVSLGREPDRDRPARPAARRRQLPRPFQRASRADPVHPAGDRRATAGSTVLDTDLDTGFAAPTDDRAGHRLSAQGRSVAVLRQPQACADEAPPRDAVRRRVPRRRRDAVPPVGARRAPVSGSCCARAPALPMERLADGWFELATRDAPPGTRTASTSEPPGASPTRPRAGIPTTSTARAASSTRDAFEWGDDAWTRPAVGRSGLLRAARRDVHARAAPSPPRSNGSTTSPTSASLRSS